MTEPAGASAAESAAESAGEPVIAPRQVSSATCQAVVARLLAAGWTADPADEIGTGAVVATDARVPGWYRPVLRHVGGLASADETRWFLSTADYTGRSGSGFAWDQLRTLGVESAVTVTDRRRVEDFWDEFLPVVFGVGGDHEHLSVSRSDSRVVHGVEPDAEDVTVVAPDLATFLEQVADGTGTHPLLRG